MTCDTATACNDMNGMVAMIMAESYPAASAVWQGLGTQEPPAGDRSWIRVTILHADGSQASLAGPVGKRRWNRIGTLVVQCFAPIATGGLDEARAMACALRDGIQGKASTHDVWFRNATIKEVGPDNKWYQVNFSVTFTYDDVQ